MGNVGLEVGSSKAPQPPLDDSVVMASGGGPVNPPTFYLPQILNSLATTMERMGQVVEKGSSSGKRKHEEDEEEEA